MSADGVVGVCSQPAVPADETELTTDETELFVVGVCSQPAVTGANAVRGELSFVAGELESRAGRWRVEGGVLRGALG